MKKSIWIILGIIAVIVLWAVSANNKIITKEENATSKWGNVQADYQRRKDLVEQAINIVKGAGNYESSTLEKVIQARNNAPQLDANDLSEENIAKFQAAYDKMAQEMTRAINVTGILTMYQGSIQVTVNSQKDFTYEDGTPLYK